MPFMSRFRKKKQDDDPLEGIEEALEEGVGEGLLMSAGAQTVEPAGAGNPASAGPDLDASASEEAPPQEDEAAEPQATDDELVAAVQAETPVPAPTLEPSDDGQVADPSEVPEAATPEAPEPSVPESEPASKEEQPSGGGLGDALAAFQKDAPTGQVGELTKGLEDVPMEELLSGLREMRSMMGLPASGDEAGVDEAGRE